jgi:hypothetical protein
VRRSGGHTASCEIARRGLEIAQRQPYKRIYARRSSNKARVAARIGAACRIARCRDRFFQFAPADGDSRAHHGHHGGLAADCRTIPRRKKLLSLVVPTSPEQAPGELEGRGQLVRRVVQASGRSHGGAKHAFRLVQPTAINPCSAQEGGRGG